MRLVSFFVNIVFIFVITFGLSLGLSQLANASEAEHVEEAEQHDAEQPERKFEAEFCVNVTLLASLEMDPHVTDDFVHFSPGICGEFTWRNRHVLVLGAAVTLERKPLPMPYLEYEYRSPTKSWFMLAEFRTAYDLAEEGLSLNGYLVAGYQHDIIEAGAGPSTWRVGEEQALGVMAYLRASPRKFIEMRFYAAPGVTIAEEPMFHMMGGASAIFKVGGHKKHDHHG